MFRDPMIVGLFVAVLGNASAQTRVGASRIDVTPETAIRLSGYAARSSETTQVEQRLYARALAIGASKESAVVVVTVDSIGLPVQVCDAIAAKVHQVDGLKRERLALCSTHSHTAPHLDGLIPHLFGLNLPVDQAARITTYTHRVIDSAAQAVHEALASMREGTLTYGRGAASFAANRRTPGGPVDHEVPLVVARDANGALIATLAAYACHNTTLAAHDDFVCGDWAGYAAAGIESAHDGAIGLIAIGCGGDQNPSPRTGLEFSKAHGAALALEIERLLASDLAPIHAAPEPLFSTIELPFDAPRTREEWENRRALGGPVGSHAEWFLSKLDSGETIPESIAYPIQTIRFGDELAMVFLAGEVVVDYAVRLKNELKRDRLFLTAYANDIPCYIPSRRVLGEGGYEAESAMTYYGRPTRLASIVEDLIVDEVRKQVGVGFVAQTSRVETLVPPTPEVALSALVVKPGHRVDLVASEPLIESPVAFDFAADGALFVVESRGERSRPRDELDRGGRVKRLIDIDNDGDFDEATIFLDQLASPSGCIEWNGGLFVCAVPDILYAKDEDGDGVAETRETWFSGFSTEPGSVGPNSLTWGLDGWVYGAAGSMGGSIRSTKTGDTTEAQLRDFRFDPRSGHFEALVGQSRWGRARDEFGEWFGCDSNLPVLHFPLEERYLALNPHIVPPPSHHVAHAGGEACEVFPLCPTLDRFHPLGRRNHVASARGIEVLKSSALGAAYRGNLFVNEPTHHLVMRLVPESDGSTFRAVRPGDEADREFLVSRSCWFRPVQAKTGPDGALWILDTVRSAVDPPRANRAEQLSATDPPADGGFGRLWRVAAHGDPLRPLPDLTASTSQELVEVLADENGALRDLAHRTLLSRSIHDAPSSIKMALVAIVGGAESASEGARVSAVYALSQLDLLDDATIERALVSNSVELRIAALRILEPRLRGQDDEWTKRSRSKFFDEFVNTSSHPRLARQFWHTVGFARVKSLFGFSSRLFQHVSFDEYGIATALSLATMMPLSFGIQEWPPARIARTGVDRLLDGFISTAIGTRDPRHLSFVVQAFSIEETCERERFTLLSRLLDACAALGTNVGRLPPSSLAGLDPQKLRSQIEALLSRAPEIASDPARPLPDRLAACSVLGGAKETRERDLGLLSELLDGTGPPALALEAVDRLGRNRSDEARPRLVAALRTVDREVRARIVDTLLERDDGCRALLEAIGAGFANGADLDATQRTRLVEHPNSDLAKRAVAQLGTPPSLMETRASLEPALKLVGEPSRGVGTFDRLCASCHRDGGRGNAVGPDLVSMFDRSPRALLMAIVDPNSAVESGSYAFAARTTAGRTLEGKVTAETEGSVVFATARGEVVTLLRSELDSLEATKRSIMSEGLLDGLSHQDVADLLAYLGKGSD